MASVNVPVSYDLVRSGPSEIISALSFNPRPVLVSGQGELVVHSNDSSCRQDAIFNQDLLQYHEIAMYVARQKGFIYFGPGILKEGAVERRISLSRLVTALEAGLNNMDEEGSETMRSNIGLIKEAESFFDEDVTFCGSKKSYGIEGKPRKDLYTLGLDEVFFKDVSLEIGYSLMESIMEDFKIEPMYRSLKVDLCVSRFGNDVACDVPKEDVLALISAVKSIQAGQSIEGNVAAQIDYYESLEEEDEINKGFLRIVVPHGSLEEIFSSYKFVMERMSGALRALQRRYDVANQQRVRDMSHMVGRMFPGPSPNDIPSEET